MPQGPTGLEAWPDILVRLTRAPVATIALIRGRATGNGSEIALACDMCFASREKAVLSQWEVGVGLVAGGGPMARLPRLIGRSRALEVLLGSDDIGGDLAASYGYVNRSLPDAELDDFVDALASRIASFDKWAIANTKRLVNAASLPPDVEIAAGWEACMTSIMRPAAQESLKKLFEQGFHKPGDVEDRLGFHVGQLGAEPPGVHETQLYLMPSNLKEDTSDGFAHAREDRCGSRRGTGDQGQSAGCGLRHRHPRQRRSHASHGRSTGLLRSRSPSARPTRPRSSGCGRPTSFRWCSPASRSIRSSWSREADTARWAAASRSPARVTWSPASA